MSGANTMSLFRRYESMFIQAAERAGNLSPEDKRKLEEQAAEKGLQALFKGAKLEIESVLRETCERVLEDPNVSRETSNLRAVALQILGEAYAGKTRLLAMIASMSALRLDRVWTESG
ncbi:X-domain of DnaJ-containing-domain-containing protein [Roridomyces roridus]|uniref:X-domain of DnaJ-containing-domain-containing protein n=1 Tax=Roridomyces roridus TaxID=1738132 RepID=A0AAD7C7N2_9AGAR|nr:X-domain of DnaJ-containing-domain-containing protein [Roridomyces roridus]